MGDLSIGASGARPVAFGVSGVCCLIVGLVVVQDLDVSLLLVGLAGGYVVLAMVTLALMKARPLVAFGMLWVVAVAAFAVYFAHTEVAHGWVTLYAGAVVASLAFAIWVALGLGLEALFRR